MIKDSPNKTARETTLLNLSAELLKIDDALNSVRTKEGRRYLVGQYTKDIYGLINFMHQVIHKDTQPYKITSTERGKKAVIESHRLENVVKKLGVYFDLYSADLHFAPDMRLFFECARAHLLRELGSGFLPNAALPDGRIEAEIANDFVGCLRAEGKRIGIKKKLRDWERNATENLKRLRAYVPALFERYSKLMVIRLDLNYVKSLVDEDDVTELGQRLRAMAADDVKRFLAGDDIDDLMEQRETPARIDIREVKKDLTRLFRNMRGKTSLFEHLVGYVSSIEFSRVGGYHVHLALFFDGSRVQKHEWYGDEIGKYWRDVITEGRGFAFNCNRNRKQYGENWAIGMVDHHDTGKREKLMQALSYMAKRDQFVYVKPSVKSNLFTTGHLPGGKPNAGRPRTR